MSIMPTTSLNSKKSSLTHHNNRVRTHTTLAKTLNLTGNLMGDIASDLTGDIASDLTGDSISRKMSNTIKPTSRQSAKMKCLHGEPCAHTTTQKGSFWFCNQNPSCNLFCSEDESYLYEKVTAAWKSTKQPHPRCEKHGKLAKMHVVKNLLKSNYGRPFFVCSDQSNPCSGFGAMYNT